MNNQSSRNYYDDQNPAYPPGTVSQSGYSYGETYSRGSYDPQHYYPSSTSPAPADPRYRSSTPMAAHSHRYSRMGDEQRYPQSSGLPATTAPGYYSTQYHSQNSQSSGDRFIPTPSDMAHSSYYSSQQSPSSGAYSAGGNQSSSSRHARHPSSSPVLSGRPSTSSRTQSSSVSPTTERYPCEVCGKTFSRSHDRKRHHETQHIPHPVVHRCRYCRKEFSRADSLKRHLDNGCDEMPSSK